MLRCPLREKTIVSCLSQFQKYYIQRALELSDGKREEAASILGIGERTLYRKIKEYGLKSP